MAITYLAKINGVDVPKIRKFKVARNKLWDDAGRNMAGTLRATYIALFPKITIEFAVLTASEMATVDGMLDTPFFTLSWWDAKTRAIKSGSYYASDYDNSLLDQERELYEGFSVNLVPVAGI